MHSTLKSKKNAAADFDLDQMMLKDSTVVEVDIEHSEKAKARSGESKTMQATGVNKHCQPAQAAREVVLEKAENQ